MCVVSINILEGIWLDLPIYDLKRNGLRVSFEALQSALIKDSKTSNWHFGWRFGRRFGG